MTMRRRPFSGVIDDDEEEALSGVIDENKETL